MGNLFFLGGVPWWAILIIALGVLLLLGYQLRQLRQRFSLSRSLFLTGLRAVVYVLLILFLFNPAFTESRVTKLRRPLAVFVVSFYRMKFHVGAEPPPREEAF